MIRMNSFDTYIFVVIATRPYDSDQSRTDIVRVVRYLALK